MKPYRGKTKEGIWVFGYLVKSIMSYGNLCYIIEHSYFPVESIPERHITEVLPESVGQQIGMVDKSGKEAYHGDKVGINPLFKTDFTITYSDATYWIEGVASSEGHYRKVKEPLSHFSSNEFEITGNTTDNPEI